MGFEKGHKGMGGRPKLKPEEKTVREITQYNLRVIVTKYWYKTRKELMDLHSKGTLPMIEDNVIRLLMEVSKSGDIRNFEVFLDRLIGKPKQIIENRNYDETKQKGAEAAEKLLLKILLDEKSDSMSKEYIASGLLKDK